MPQNTTSTKISTDVTAVTLIAAITAALGAFAIFQPKLAIGVAMKRETGSVEPAFRWLYVVPQYINIAVIIGLCMILIAAFVQSISPNILPQCPFLTLFGGFFVLDNILWILFWAAVIVAVVKGNWLSWTLLILCRAVSLLPIHRIQGVFGPNGRSAGWLQAWNICRAWDKGQPLLICHDKIVPVADTILYRLSQPDTGASNFAATPAATSVDARANIALFGCILEATHYVHNWTPPAWSEFYASLATIHSRSGLFDPKKLQEFESGSSFASQLRNELVAEITLRSQPIPQDQYLAAADSLASTWEQLSKYSGSVLNLIPSWARWVGGRLYWLDRRLSRLPMLHNKEGMRPQLIKLLLRWQTIPWDKTSVFIQPFAKKQSWLLLQEAVLRVLPEQKDVTYWTIGDVQLTRIACMELFEIVSAKVRLRQSEEAREVDKKYPTKWDLYAAADFSLWNLASENVLKGQSENWEAKKGWRWKLEDGRAYKIS
ncbi:MAG: hypothetical protein WB870_16305 [Gallionellaceae bacterium]